MCIESLIFIFHYEITRCNRVIYILDSAKFVDVFAESMLPVMCVRVCLHI